LLSVTINDDHTIAVGTCTGKDAFTKGKIHIYDVRTKQAVHTIEADTSKGVTKIAFQPPKWAISAAAKTPATTPNVPAPIIAPINAANITVDAMEMFSPINKGLLSFNCSQSESAN
jgi:hypothetical protein